jgi:membrane protein YqaA with SNARE-associated domain
MKDMIVLTLASMLEGVLKYMVLFLLGRILINPIQLRNYLGMKSLQEEVKYFEWTVFWIEKMGRLLMFFAVIGIISSVITTIAMIDRMN